jgi:hypothetical protein
MFATALTCLLLSAAPAPAAALPEIQAPLGHIGNVVTEVPKGGVNVADKAVIATFDGCQPQAISLMAFLGGTMRAVEQLEGWLNQAGLQKKLFKKKDQLGEVVRLLTDARLEPKHACAALPVTAGFQVELADAARKWCPSPPAQTTGDYWFFNKGKASAVVNVLPGAPDACKPRLSSVLFDASGQARVRFHADWGGQLSATLVGDGCQVVDFTFNTETQRFVPSLRRCKR